MTLWHRGALSLAIEFDAIDGRPLDIVFAGDTDRACQVLLGANDNGSRVGGLVNDQAAMVKVTPRGMICGTKTPRRFCSD